MHGEGTDTESNVASGKSVLFQDAVNFLRTLHCDRIPVKGFYVAVKDLITLGVSSTSKDVPESKYGLRNDLYAVAGITTDEQASLVVHNFILQGREDVVHDVPVVVGVADTTEGSLRVEFGKESLEEDTLTIRVNVRILVVLVVLDVLRTVGTHDEVLRGDSTERNLLLLAVTVVVLLEVRDYRDGSTVGEGKAPCGCSLQRSVKSLVTTEVEVTESLTARHVVITGLVVPLVHDFTVGVTDGSTDHGIPHLGGNQGFESLTKPSEVRMGVGDTEDRAVDRNLHTLRECDDFDGEITEPMETTDFLVIAQSPAHGVVHHTGVLCNNLFLGLVEEVLIEVVDEPGLAESLDAVVHNAVPTIDTAGTGSEIGN